MNTLTLNQIKQNADLLFLNYGKEKFIIKNKNNQVLLLTPLLLDDISKIKLNKKNTENKISFEEFDKKWKGFIKDVKLPENWREDYTNDKKKKHQ